VSTPATNLLLGVGVIGNTTDFDSVVIGSNPVPSAILILQGAVMKHKMIVKQRNRFVVLALQRKAGVHRKSNKALRRQHNASIAQLVEQ
jgi:hypothetical protein